MVLTGSKINEEIRNKSILIRNYGKENVGTESIDLTLGKFMKRLETNDNIFIPEYDAYMKCVNPSKQQIYTDLTSHEYPNRALGENQMGFFLRPGELYLAATNEFIGTKKYHMALHDKSSLMRIGVSTHGNSGFGDLGFFGNWTLEIQVVKETILFIGMTICQISFQEVSGEVDYLYSDRKSSKYHLQEGPTESRIDHNFIDKL